MNALEGLNVVYLDKMKTLYRLYANPFFYGKSIGIHITVIL